MVAPDTLLHSGRECHHLLLTCLGIDIRCAVGIDGRMQIGSTLQTVVGDRVVLVEGTLCIQDLIAELAGELHAQVEVLILEGVAPSEDDLWCTIA